MRNGKPTMSSDPEIQNLWNEYFRIMREAPENAQGQMARIYSQIEKLQLAHASRRTTMRMLACAVESAERVTRD